MALDTNVKMEYMDSEMMADTHNVTLEETANVLQTVKVCSSPNPMDGLIFSPLLSNDIKKEPNRDLSLGEEHFIDQKEPEEFQKPVDLEMTPDELEAAFNIQPPLHAYTRKFKKSTKTKKIGTRQRKVDSSKTNLRNKNSKNIHRKPNKSVVKKAQQNKTCGKTIKKTHSVTKTAKEMTLTSKKYQCELCNVIFPQKKMLVKHKKLHKNIKKTFPCKVCKESFSDIISLLKHSQIHSNKKNCNVCSESFNDAATLKAHRKTHIVEKSFKCDVCNKSFFHVTRLKIHSRTHKPKKVFKCDFCRKSFKNLMNLKYHLPSHKKKDKNLQSDPPKPASIDDKAHVKVDEASTSSTLLKPMTETTPKNSTICVICNRSFKSCQSLKIHMRSHENDKQKPASLEDKPDDKSTVRILKPQIGCKTPFKCDACNKSLKTKMALRFHSKTHKSHKILGKRLEREPLKPDTNGDNSDGHEVGTVDIQGEEDRCANFDDYVDEAVDSRGEDEVNTNIDDSCGGADGGMDIEGEAEDNREDATDITGADVEERMDIRGEAEVNREDATDITDKDQIECIVSFEPFACLENREIHRKRHSSKKTMTGNPAPFLCVVCGKNLSSKDSLQTHLRIHTEEKPFVCDICSKAFSDKGALKKHSVTHSRERNHRCEICGRGFGLAGLLTRHMSVHSGEKPFKCKVCDRAYKRKTECNLHYRKQHCDLEVKVCKEKFAVERAKCNLCQSLVKKTYMKEHMKCHRLTVRSFTCDVCPLAFVRRASLVRHMKTHTGEKPHKCDREGCEMAYLARSDLLRHIRNFHDNYRPFSCDVCKKDFVDKTRLEFHSSEHTGKYRYTCNNCGKKFNYRSRYHRHLARTLKCKRKPEQRNTQKSDAMRQRRLKRARFTKNEQPTPANSEVANSQKSEKIAGFTKNEQSITANSDVVNSQKSDSMEQKRLKRAGFTENEQSTTANSDVTNFQKNDSVEPQKMTRAGFTENGQSTPANSDVANSQKSDSMEPKILTRAGYTENGQSTPTNSDEANSQKSDTMEPKKLTIAGFTENEQSTPANSDVANSQKSDSMEPKKLTRAGFTENGQSTPTNSDVANSQKSDSMEPQKLARARFAENGRSTPAKSDVANSQKSDTIEQKKLKKVEFTKNAQSTPADSMGQKILIRAPNFSEQFALFAGFINNGQSTQTHSGVANSQKPELVAKPLSTSYPLLVTPASPNQPKLNREHDTTSTLDDTCTDLSKNKEVIEKNKSSENSDLPKTSKLPASECTDVEESPPHGINLGYKTSKLPASESTDVEESLPHRINLGYKPSKLPASECTDVEESPPHRINLGYKCDVCNDRFPSSKDLHIHIIMHLKANMSPRVDARGVTQMKGKTPGPVADIDSQEEKYRQWLNQRGNPLFDAPRLKVSPSAVVVEKGLSMLIHSGAAECSDDDNDYDGHPANDGNGVKEQDGHTLEKSVHTEVDELKNQEKSGQEPVNNGNKAPEVMLEIQAEELNNADEKSGQEPVNIGNEAMEVMLEIQAEELNNADDNHLLSKADNKESVAAPFFEDGDSDDSMVINVSSILPKNIF